MSTLFSKITSRGTQIAVVLVALMLLAQPVTAVAPVAVVGWSVASGMAGAQIGMELGDDTEGMGAEEVEQELFRDALSYQDSVEESMVWSDNTLTDIEQVAIGHGQYATSEALMDDEAESVMQSDARDAVEDHYSLVLSNQINSFNSEIETIHSAAQIDLATEGTDNEVYHVIHGDIVDNDDFEGTDERLLWTEDTEVEYGVVELPNGDEEEVAKTLTNMESPGITGTHDVSLIEPDNPTASSTNAPDEDAFMVFQALDPDKDYSPGEPITLLDTDEHHVSFIDDLEDEADRVADDIEVYASDIHDEYEGADVEHIDVVDPSVLATIGSDVDESTFAATAASAAGYSTSAEAPATFKIVEEDGTEIETSGLLTTRAKPDTTNDDGDVAWVEGETYAADDHDEDILIQAIDEDGNVEPWVLEDGDEMTITDISDGDSIVYNEHSYSEYDSSEYISELEAQNERLESMLEERQSGIGFGGWFDDLGFEGQIAVIGGVLVVLVLVAGIMGRAARP